MPRLDGEGRTPQERAGEAVQLRMMGLTYVQIAETLGYSDRAAAFNAVSAELTRQDDDGAESRRAAVAVMLNRLDRLLRGLWADASAGDPAAVDRVLAIEKRRAELLNFAAPVAPAEPVTQEDGVTSISAARAARKARAAAQQLPQP